MHHYYNVKKSTELSISRLVFVLGISGISTIWALYLSDFGLSNSTIGFISSFLMIVSLLASLFISSFLENLRELKVYLLVLMVYLISYLMIYFFDNLGFFLMISIVIAIATSFDYSSFNILFRDEVKSHLNEEEGLLWSLLNVGWLIGPVLAGFIAELYGTRMVFISTSIFISISLFILITLTIPKHRKKFVSADVLGNIKSFFENSKLRMPYLVLLAIQAWQGLIFIYMPLFILGEGLSKTVVGIFISATMLPLVLVEYKVSVFSEKHGFKNFFVLGFSVLALSSFILFFFGNIYFAMVLIVLSGFALACIEPLQDTYFFKQVTSNQEEKFYPVFQTGRHIGTFLGRIIPAIFLLFLPNKVVFLIYSAMMLLVAIVAMKKIN